MSDPKEKFYRHFQAEVNIIQDQINDLATLSPIGGERQDCHDTILASISRLSNEVLDAADYIPAYDQRTYSQAIKALTEKLNEATGKFATKSRFQFKPRAAKSTAQAQPSAPDPRLHNPFPNANANANATDDDNNTAGSSVAAVVVGAEARDAVGTLPSFGKNYNEELSRAAGAAGGVRKPSFSGAKNIAIYGQAGLHIMLPATASRATSSGSLADLDRCVVDMTVPTSGGAPFAGLALRDIRRSLVVAGHVAGPAHVTGVEDSVVVVAARQVRMHECRNVDVYLHCQSHPIIEDCSGMRFAPLPDLYASDSTTATTNQWDQVDDFKWLKSEPSPNWSVLPEDQRIEPDTWRYTVCGNPSVNTDDILRKVGVLKS
ncbi:tubulin binding cofactor C [Biscogniauxia mediterranea]|nr:tubulin binding cofactor C [Biscogniauxia mediterranea]